MRMMAAGYACPECGNEYTYVDTHPLPTYVCDRCQHTEKYYDVRYRELGVGGLRDGMHKYYAAINRCLSEENMMRGITTGRYTGWCSFCLEDVEIGLTDTRAYCGSEHCGCERNVGNPMNQQAYYDRLNNWDEYKGGGVFED